MAGPDRPGARALGGGWAFIKVFTCTTHGVPGFDPGHLIRLFRAIADTDAICLVHCEDETIVDRAEGVAFGSGRDDPSVIIEWRRREAELSALAVMSQLARPPGHAS